MEVLCGRCERAYVTAMAANSYASHVLEKALQYKPIISSTDNSNSNSVVDERALLSLKHKLIRTLLADVKTLAMDKYGSHIVEVAYEGLIHSPPSPV